MLMENGMQTGYSRAEVPALPGLLAYESSGKDNIFTYLLAAGVAALNFGLGVVRDVLGGIRLPVQNVSLITFVGDFVTSNVINLKLNGVAMSPVTFTTDTDTTLGLIATAIEAMDDVDTAVIDTSARTILVTMTSGVVVVISNIVVTAGAGQTTGSATYTSTDKFVGQPVYDPMRVSGTGFLPYFDIAVATATQGIWVYVSEDVVKGDAAYLDPSDGTYTNVAAGNIPTGGQFNTDAADGELAVVILNQPNI